MDSDSRFSCLKLYKFSELRFRQLFDATAVWRSGRLCPPLLGVPAACGFHDDSIHPDSPKTGKTKSRRIPLHPQFATLVSDWMFKSPLADNRTDCTWPFPGQKLRGTAPVFPGLSKRAGHRQWWKRQWSKPVSERAYLGPLNDLVQVLKREIRKDGKSHAWSDVDVDMLGTHSLKRSAAT